MADGSDGSNVRPSDVGTLGRWTLEGWLRKSIARVADPGPRRVARDVGAGGRQWIGGGVGWLGAISSVATQISSVATQMIVSAERLSYRAEGRQLWSRLTFHAASGVTVINGPSASGMTVQSVLQTAASLWELRDAQAAIERELMRWRLHDLTRRRLATLSERDQRRVLLAASLIMQPRVWLVDRPFASLDVEGQVIQQTLLVSVLTESDPANVPELVMMADVDARHWPSPKAQPIGTGGQDVAIWRLYP